MTKNLVSLLVVVVIAGAVNDRQASAQDSEPRKEVGRYQLVASTEGIFLLDTATGQCWFRRSARDWFSEGNPTKTAQGKPARSPHKPPHLELPDETVELTIIQREERAIPGSEGTVRLRLGDITEGQAHLSVVTADGDFLHEKVSVQQGNKLEFTIGKKEYVLQVHELRNILIGDDFARISVRHAAGKRFPDEPRPQNQQPSDRPTESDANGR